MADLSTILTREDSNKDRIYLYYSKDRWIAYGQSACLLRRICSQVRMFNTMEKNTNTVCAYINMEALLDISPHFPTVIGDDFVEIVTGSL